MNAAVLYLPYLPNVNWFRNFLLHENIFIEREENFVKSSYRNRCEISSVNGKQILSIPLVGGRDHHRLYKDVRIDYSSHWNNKHWQSIQSAYGSAPFFEHYADKLKPLYKKRFEFLFDFNLELLHALLNILKVKKEFTITSAYEKSYTEIIDLRNNKTIEIHSAKYHQVFEDRNGFIENLSIIDLVFNAGNLSNRLLAVG